MKMSGGGLLALKQSEGCRLDAYQDEAGVWTIGYGDTHQVKPGDRITLEEAEGLLLLRVDQFERAVRAAVKRPMTQGQFDALTSLCYNIGSAAFSASELVKQFNADEVENAARQFARWIHVKGEEARASAARTCSSGSVSSRATASRLTRMASSVVPRTQRRSCGKRPTATRRAMVVVRAWASYGER